MTLTPEMVEIERAAFEAEMRTADNYDAKYMKRDSAHPDYYANRIMQAVWEGWCMKTRAQSQLAVTVADDAVLIRREVYDFLMGHGDLRGLWFGDRGDHKGAFWWREDLRALIDRAGGGA